MIFVSLCLCGLFYSPSPAAEPSTGTSVGWVKQASSLLLYDSSGTLASETGLGYWEDASPSRVDTLEIRGGASANGRFAWLLEKKSSENPQRTKRLSNSRRFEFLGTSGDALWTSAEVDVPAGAPAFAGSAESGSPAILSADGEVVIVALRRPAGWFASIRNYLGNAIVEAGPWPSLLAVSLTSNGKYALARWVEHDKSATHTFVEVATKRVEEIPSGELTLGTGRIEDDGKVYSGKRVAFDFLSPGAPASTTTATAQP